MTNPRSLPEKTLEHWISTYVQYRYRSNASLWWPTQGEPDITVGDGRLGKSFGLEVKTAQPTSANSVKHDVEINLVQLNLNMTQMTAYYYVIPLPPWAGSLERRVSRPWLGGTPRSDLGFKRSDEKWFGKWVIVVSALDLFRAYGSPASQEKHFKVLRYDSATRETLWTPSATPIPSGHISSWSDFWRLMEKCGSDWMPAQFTVPARPGPSVGRVTRDDLVRLLVNSRVNLGGLESEPETWVPRLDSAFRVQYESQGERGSFEQAVSTGGSGHRVDVHLGSRALTPQ